MNKNKKIWFYILSALLVLIAITGFLEQSSFEYVKGISEKNLGFLGLVTELKIILSGVSDFVPFLKEHNGAFNESLEKAEHYLLIVNVISLVQLMLLELSKAWLVKLFIIVLFISTFFNSSKRLTIRLLILVLALNPGLQIFSITMHQLSTSTSIDYGQEYLSELKASVDTMQVEKSQLMQEHANKLTEINNGKKGIVFFKKLKEDISYDLKKAKTTIKGDYSEIRRLIRDGGKEIIRKLFIFCTMVLFSLFIVPIGYAIVVFTIYRTVITAEVKQELEAIEDEVKNKVVEEPIAKIKSVLQWPKNILKSGESKIKEAEEKVDQKVEHVETTITEKEDSIKSKIEKDKAAAEEKIVQPFKKAKQKVEGLENKVTSQENMIEGEIKKTEESVKEDEEAITKRVRPKKK